MSSLVDKDHTWSFDSPSQLTAPNYLYEAIGFSGLLLMDFTEPMQSGDSLSSISSATVTDIALNTEPTISASAVSTDKRGALLTVATASATANTYTVNVTSVTTNGETIVRRGRLVLA